MDNTKGVADVNAIAETRNLVTAVKLKELYMKKKHAEELYLPVLAKVTDASTEKEKLKILVELNERDDFRYSGIIFDTKSAASDILRMSETDPTISDELFKPLRVEAEQGIHQFLRKIRYTSLFGSIFNEWMNFEGKSDLPDDEKDGVKTPKSDDESTMNLTPDIIGRPEKYAQKAELEGIIFAPDPNAKPEEFITYLEDLFKEAEVDARKAAPKKRYRVLLPRNRKTVRVEDESEEDDDGSEGDIDSILGFEEEGSQGGEDDNIREGVIDADDDSDDDDEDDDDQYLNGYRDELFTLSKLRNTVGRFSGSVRKHDTFFRVDVKQAIHGLVSGELLTEAKKAACKEILLSDVILDEIASVLTLRLREIENWKYSDPAIQLNFRRHLNGKYRCYADEPILDAIFLQLIGVKWGMELRRVLGILHKSGAWCRPKGEIDAARQEVRSVMLPKESTETPQNSIDAHNKAFMKEFFLTLLPESLYDFRTYNEDGEEADQEKKDNDKIRRARNEELKQMLLQRLLIDRQYAEAVNPGASFTVVQADAYRFAQSQSHEIILALMKFIGVTHHWLKFFETFLKLPAKFESGGEVRESKRGVPISHPLGLVFGEIQLFFMEFAINRATGGDLQVFRMHDDIWWWGSDEAKCELTWDTILKYSALTGTDWNLEKSGCARISKQPVELAASTSSKLPTGDISWGFIKLGRDGVWKIKEDEVEKHTAELKIQMDSQKSILGIIGAYNRYMKFFVRNFAKPAPAFGKQHIDQIVAAIEKIHMALFPSHNGDVLAYVASLVSSRFGEEVDGPIIPAWLLMPVAYGGLGVRNVLFDIYPTMRAYQVKEDDMLYRRKRKFTIYDRPEDFSECIDRDKVEYEEAKEAWMKNPKSVKFTVNWLNEVPDEWFDGSVKEWEQARQIAKRSRRREKPHPFITFEEFILGRRNKFHYWGDVWKGLSVTPENFQRYAFPDKIIKGLSNSGIWGSEPEWLKVEYGKNTSYWKSYLLSFGEQALNAFGSFKITRDGSLPVGMIGIYTNLKTKWDQ
ncbi:hypothetical protein ABW19_dt0209571 [Dactylella cylindrospora]|nr:hypothetical protein ABW19_dt0209571 [Dactylella cylindrospora]